MHDDVALLADLVTISGSVVEDAILGGPGLSCGAEKTRAIYSTARSTELSAELLGNLVLSIQVLRSFEGTAAPPSYKAHAVG